MQMSVQFMLRPRAGPVIGDAHQAVWEEIEDLIWNWKNGKKGGSKLCDYCCRLIVKGLFGVSQVKIIEESIIHFFKLSVTWTPKWDGLKLVNFTSEMRSITGPIASHNCWTYCFPLWSRCGLCDWLAGDPSCWEFRTFCPGSDLPMCWKNTVSEKMCWNHSYMCLAC